MSIFENCAFLHKQMSVYIDSAAEITTKKVLSLPGTSFFFMLLLKSPDMGKDN